MSNAAAENNYSPNDQQDDGARNNDIAQDVEETPRRPRTLVPTLAKTAYLALDPGVRARYDADVAIKMDVRECCERVWRLIAVGGGHAGPDDGDLCAQAAGLGHDDCLQIAHEAGCPWDTYTCPRASGPEPCPAYAHEDVCPWDASACRGAAAIGNLDCLRYAHENGCPWDGTTCAAAAVGGHLECLRYAHDHGCQWYDTTTELAAINGNLECLKYAVAAGCPINVPVLIWLLEDVDEYAECLEFVLQLDR